ncbi:MAG TPA: MBL fold metallo-hydrolase [Flavobacteriaceae bacterium]|nr:MBL fold metallo-hydrolase [Flavobacteriaceae bacterium]
MKHVFQLILLAFILLIGCKNKSELEASASQNSTVSTPNLNIHPIHHATMVLEWDGVVIYVDPVGGKTAFEGHSYPDIILVTDVHGDHLNISTIDSILTSETRLITPIAVYEVLPDSLKQRVTQLVNDETKTITGIAITGVPMYNLREEALSFHTKGRGNGYVLEKDNYRIYISGDTEDIPEMRALQAIDLAFVCMNLPFTMPIESAAAAVAHFKPKTVVPYHYRGREGFSDVDKFERLVQEKAPEVKVKRLDFYP